MFKHFSLKEFLVSPTATKLGINQCDYLTFSVVHNLELLCGRILEPLRLDFAEPIRITSGFRCAPLNVAVGGVPSSNHLKGLAADITPYNYSYGDLIRLFELAHHTPYNELILYPDKHMFHISLKV